MTPFWAYFNSSILTPNLGWFLLRPEISEELPEKKNRFQSSFQRSMLLPEAIICPIKD